VFDELEHQSRLRKFVSVLARKDPARRPARTFPAALPWFRLDRIYVRGFKVEQAEVLHGPQWAKLSDHAPIVANLQLA
jgi:endonuclease/exonuclease/phosphatase family metal-dependent hydrolase